MNPNIIPSCPYTMEQIRTCAEQEKICEMIFAPSPFTGAETLSLQKAMELSLPEQAKENGAGILRLVLCENTAKEQDILENFILRCRENALAVEVYLSRRLFSGEAAKFLFAHKIPVTLFLGFSSGAEQLLSQLEMTPYAEKKEWLTVAFTMRRGDTEKILRQAETILHSGYGVTSHCLGDNGELLPEKELPPSDEQLLLEKFFGEQLFMCVKHLYSCFADRDGRVYPCMGKGFALGDLKEKDLSAILLESKYLELLRQHPQRIKEPCQSCTHIARCCGNCRVRAYRYSGDYLAADPFCRYNQGKSCQIRKLPIAAKGLLPHAGPMELIDRMIFLSEEKSVHETVIRPDNPFLDENGFLERAALPEFAAQSCAVRDSVEKGGTPSPGLLSEVKNCIFYNEKVKANDTLRITVRTEFHMDIWYGIAFRIEKDDKTPVAEGNLKLCIYDGIEAPY